MTPPHPKSKLQAVLNSRADNKYRNASASELAPLIVCNAVTTPSTVPSACPPVGDMLGSKTIP